MLCISKQYANAGISTLMSFSDGLSPSIFCQKTERTRPMGKEMDGKVFIYRLIWQFYVDVFFKVLFHICTLTWHVNNYVFANDKVKIEKTKVPTLKKMKGDNRCY